MNDSERLNLQKMIQANDTENTTHLIRNLKHSTKILEEVELLLKLMLEKEPNFKIIANFLLHRIEPLKKYIMPVNPFENHKDVKSSVIGLKETFRHLSDGKPLGMFPAGEVSTYKDGKLVVDKPWEEGAIKVIRKAQVPVVPIYFHAKNSGLFYLLSKSIRLEKVKNFSNLFGVSLRIYHSKAMVFSFLQFIKV